MYAVGLEGGLRWVVVRKHGRCDEMVEKCAAEILKVLIGRSVGDGKV